MLKTSKTSRLIACATALLIVCGTAALLDIESVFAIPSLQTAFVEHSHG